MKPVMLTEHPTMQLPSAVSTATREPSTVLWGMVIVVLATPMLLPFAVRWAFAGPDAGIVRTGVVLTELVVVIGWALSTRGFFLPRRISPAVALGGLWGLASVAATLAADHVAPAVLRSAEWMSHGMFAAVLWSAFQQDRGRVLMAQQAIAIGFVVLTGLIAVAALRMPDPASHDWTKLVPFVSIPGVPNIGNIRYLGVYALAGAVFSSRGLLDPTASRSARQLALAGLTLGWSVMIWTGGRGSVGAMLVAGGAMWWMAGVRRGAFVKSFGFAMIVGALLSLCLPIDQFVGLWRILGLKTVESVEAFTSGRTAIWATSLDAWQQQPWLGIGSDGASFVLASFGHVQSHNVFVDALIDWGLVGAIPFAGLMMWLLYRGYALAFRENDTSMRASRTVATVFLFAATANAMLDGLYYDARCLLLIAAVAVMALLPADRAVCSHVSVSRRTRLAMGGVAASLIVLFCVHIAAVRAVWAPGIPSPDSPRVVLLKAFPSPSHLRETAYWVADWKVEHPGEALEMARWGSQHAHLSWFYLRQEAGLLLERGHRDEAMKQYVQAERMEAEALRYAERR